MSDCPKKEPRFRTRALRLYLSGGGERYRVALNHLQAPCQEAHHANTLICRLIAIEDAHLTAENAPGLCTAHRRALQD